MKFIFQILSSMTCDPSLFVIGEHRGGIEKITVIIGEFEVIKTFLIKWSFSLRTFLSSGTSWIHGSKRLLYSIFPLIIRFLAHFIKFRLQLEQLKWKILQLRILLLNGHILHGDYLVLLQEHLVKTLFVMVDGSNGFDIRNLHLILYFLSEERDMHLFIVWRRLWEQERAVL